MKNNFSHFFKMMLLVLPHKIVIDNHKFILSLKYQNLPNGRI